MGLTRELPTTCGAKDMILKKNLKNKKLVLLVIKILNLLKIDTHDWESTSMSKLTNLDKSKTSEALSLTFLLKNLPELFNQMICARLFSQKF